MPATKLPSIDVGVPLPVESVNISDPDPTRSASLLRARRSRRLLRRPGCGWRALQAARGLWYDTEKIYFISTDGGNMGFGQVWIIHLAAENHAGGRVLRARHVRWSRQLLRQPSR